MQSQPSKCRKKIICVNIKGNEDPYVGGSRKRERDWWKERKQNHIHKRSSLGWTKDPFFSSKLSVPSLLLGISSHCD